ncbi:MAG: response regulator [Acidobacteria bacterium]|nr:response regulator [Acidobacteriota bacterium]
MVADKNAGLGFTIQDFLVKPVNADALLAAVGRAASPGAEGSPILVVDDDPNALKLAAQALTAAGYRPLTERDAESGLRIAAKEHPTLVILDLLMPGMDGFEFLRRFRRTKQGRHTPVIVWTVKDLTAEERARLQASAQAVVLKGAGSSAELLADIETHMASRRR